mmetsp:Transcript_31993/g.75370  ORF Transcript_31993/g.75370 Transcript_31993/m.75370 type:complete len:202 (+) Transcript_31993:814-1419(+)
MAEPPDREARHDDEHLLVALDLFRHDEHLGEGRVQRKLHHFAACCCELPRVAQRPEDPKLVHGVEHDLLGRGVHEVEVQQVLDAEGLEEEDDVAEVGALDLRDRVVQHLKLVGRLGVEAPRNARPRPPCPPLPLPRVRLALGSDLERVHAHARVVDLELIVAAVDDVLDAVDRQRRLCDVRRHHHLAGVALNSFEDLGLDL